MLTQICHETSKLVADFLCALTSILKFGLLHISFIYPIIQMRTYFGI
jgi:hypothetical protein